MMQPDATPFRIPDHTNAADEAKVFCRERGLTPDKVKITRKDGFVSVVVIKPCWCGDQLPKISACGKCFRLKVNGKECKGCAVRQM